MSNEIELEFAITEIEQQYDEFGHGKGYVLLGCAALVVLGGSPARG